MLYIGTIMGRLQAWIVAIGFETAVGLRVANGAALAGVIGSGIGHCLSPGPHRFRVAKNLL